MSEEMPFNQLFTDAEVKKLKQGLRTRHSHDGHSCQHCRAPAGPIKKLRGCKACDSVWYCDEVCQKRDWKAHKPGCLAHRQSLAGQPAHVLKLHAAVKAWDHRHWQWVFWAGHEALLPGPGYLVDQGHLLDTHYLLIILNEVMEGSGDFAIELASLTLIPNDEKLKFTDQTRRAKAELATGGAKDEMVGMMWIAIVCREIQLNHFSWISQTDLDDRKDQRKERNWETALRLICGPVEKKMYIG